VTSIDFYFNAEDRYAVACRLAGKAMRQNLRTLVYAPDPESARRIDRMLWTARAVSFIPHCYASDAAAAPTPVLIAMGEESAPDCQVLLNLSDECPPFFERHPRLLEVVSQEEAARKAGRARFAFYRDRGYQIRNHDLAKADASSDAGSNSGSK
jgi:DNA polymerase-3 subunit chi